MGTITKQQIPVLVARLVEFQEKFGSLSGDDGQFVIQNTAEAIELAVEAIKKRNTSKLPILKLVSGGKELVLRNQSGKRLIYEADEIFKSYIDYNFGSPRLANIGVPTPRTLVEVRNIVQDAFLMDIFTSLPGYWERRWFSQSQIIEFSECLFGWLSKKGNTFFLIKKDETKPVEENNPAGNLAAVRVCWRKSELSVHLNELSYPNYPKKWERICLNRVVSPLLIS